MTTDPMLDCLPHLIWQTDNEGNMTYANSSWRDYTGLVDKDIRSTWKDLMHPEDSDRAHSTWMECISKKAPRTVECRIKRGSDGEYFWHKVFSHYVEKLAMCIGTAIYIHKEMQRDELYCQLVHAVSEPIVTFDAESGIINSCNPAMEHTFLYSSAALQGQSVNVLLPESFVTDTSGVTKAAGIIAEYAGICAPAKLTMMGENTHHSAVRRDGKSIPVTLSFGGYERYGRTHYIAILQPVQDAQDPSTDMLRQSKDNFLSTVSHELRTPLFGLLGTISTMQAAQDVEISFKGAHESYRWEDSEGLPSPDSPTPLSDPPSSTSPQVLDKVQELHTFSRDMANLNDLLLHDLGLRMGNRELLPSAEEEPKTYSTTLHTELRQMEECARSLLNIVNNMIDYYKLEHLVNSPLAVRFQPSALLAEECGNFQSHVGDDVEFVYRTQDDVPDTLVADSTLLRHVISNLVSNALRFTRKGKVEVTLSMQEQTKGPCLVLVVQDTGSGIPPDYFPHIYSPFYPLEPNKKFGGVGLGLAVCKRTVELMKGEITFSSTVGRGTRFEVTVPVTINPPNKIGRSLSLRELILRDPPEQLRQPSPDNCDKCPTKLVRSKSEKSRRHSSLVGYTLSSLSSSLAPSSLSAPSSSSLASASLSPSTPSFLSPMPRCTSIEEEPSPPFPRPSQDLCVIPECNVPSTPPLSPVPPPPTSRTSSTSAPPTPHKITHFSPPHASIPYYRRPSFPFTVDDPTTSLMLLPNSPYISSSHRFEPLPPFPSSPPSPSSRPVSALTRSSPSHYPPSLHIRVLVVEDNVVNQSVIKKMLKRMECIVVIADNGKEALGMLFDPNNPAYYGYHNCDLILMDCQMPVMDGFEATKRIRQWESKNNKSAIRIAALTANGSSDNEKQCYAAGMDGFISKPVTIHGLHHILLPGQPLLTSSSV